MSKDRLKDAVLKALDARAPEVIRLGDMLLRTPEIGYREFSTARTISGILKGLGLDTREGLAITGVKACIPGRLPRPSVAMFCEMDAIVCHAHPDSHAQTGAVHACGHNAQVAAMLGAVMGLLDAGVMPDLEGSVIFVGVPAEEYVEMEIRNGLRHQGKIRFFGGKQEMLYRGHLDDVDMALMFHLDTEIPPRHVRFCNASSGFIGKVIQYIGREAHSASPGKGVNALNAALLGLMGVHVQRETFEERDNVRVHPIITKGGDLVNIIPGDVRLETYVRGNNMEAVIQASRKVDRALQAGAWSVGARVHIQNVPGYLPLEPDAGLSGVLMGNLRYLLGREAISPGSSVMGSTDMGDITQVMPGVHLMVGGARGLAHARDFRIVDKEMAYILPAKAMALSIIDLLYPEGGKAYAVLEGFRPRIARGSHSEEWERILARVSSPISHPWVEGQGD